jgi:hypothetical protein
MDGLKVLLVVALAALVPAQPLSAGAPVVRRVSPALEASVALPSRAASPASPSAPDAPLSPPPSAGPAVRFSMDRSMVGVNVATWDYQMIDPSTPDVIRRLGVGVQQFPNLVQWNWHTDLARNAQDGYRSWDTFRQPLDLSGWGRILRQSGTSGLYIVPYGANPDWTGGETVDDVRQLTQYIVTHQIPVRAMVIGSEEYGSWALNLTGDRSPQRYAQTAIQMIRAIREVAPGMLVGVDVVDPADPLHPMPQDLAWNRAVISACAPYIQFVSAHSYPVNRIEGDAAMLRTLAAQIGRSMRFLRSQLDQFAGADAAHIQVWITEFNVYNGTSEQSLKPVFAAAAVEGTLAWLADGADQVDWWSLHGDATEPLPTGANMAATPLVTRPGAPFGTFGLASEAIPPQPAPVNALYPAGQGLAELMQAVGDGAHVAVWPDLMTARGLFVAEVDSGRDVSLVVVNTTDQTQSLTLGGASLEVGPAGLVMRRINAATGPTAPG